MFFLQTAHRTHAQDARHTQNAVIASIFARKIQLPSGSIRCPLPCRCQNATLRPSNSPRTNTSLGSANGVSTRSSRTSGQPRHAVQTAAANNPNLSLRQIHLPLHKPPKYIVRPVRDGPPLISSWAGSIMPSSACLTEFPLMLTGCSSTIVRPATLNVVFLPPETHATESLQATTRSLQIPQSKRSDARRTPTRHRPRPPRPPHSIGRPVLVSQPASERNLSNISVARPHLPACSRFPLAAQTLARRRHAHRRPAFEPGHLHDAHRSVQDLASASPRLLPTTPPAFRTPSPIAPTAARASSSPSRVPTTHSSPMRLTSPVKLWSSTPASPSTPPAHTRASRS